MLFPPPTPPVVGGIPAHHSGQGNHPITRVVVHSAVMDNRPGAARLLGEWNARGTTGGSWHYSVDAEGPIQCSYDRWVCWHAPPNGHSIGIEMADRPAPVPTVTGKALRQFRKTWRWRTARHKAMLDHTARLVAELCLAYELPPRYVGPIGLKLGRRGWTTHRDVTLAFRQSTHWDPGFWPRRRFGRLVASYYADAKLGEGVNA